MLSGNDVRTRFLDFFAKKSHEIVPSASLVPENDPSVLFNTAGMQPLVPYLMGQPHPTGKKRIANAQKCLRTNDIEEVGDNTHLTFFEMLGNWSLGDYFKGEAIRWSYEFLTAEECLSLDPKRLYVTVFAGDENAPKDEEAYQVWKEIFIEADLDPEKRIFFMDAEENWWSPGDNGPCGPDSEMFYDVTGKHTNGLTREEFATADERQEVVEIWNDVFMEYEKQAGEVVGKLASKNVDTGSGLERITAVVQNKNSVFETDLFTPIVNKIESIATADLENQRAVRIIADHIRASVFLLADGVSVSNTDQGYVLRRLLRRSIQQANVIGIPEEKIVEVADSVIKIYQDAYPVLVDKQSLIKDSIISEEQQFRKTLDKGMGILQKIIGKGSESSDTKKEISAQEVFDLFSTYGFPVELTKDIANEAGFTVDQEGFTSLMQEHKEKSRAGAQSKFKGGLGDHSENTVAYHTTTHLLLAGLRKFLGEHVHQAGSNITAERLRFDFTHDERLDTETLQEIENWVNRILETGGTVQYEKMSKTEAQADSTIEGSFWDRYPDEVYVYTITTSTGDVVSRELCGGPHVADLSEIKGKFTIKKESSSAQGIRRIKAILE